MIDTKLILIEGVPCSGKSTTAKKLAAAISARGIECRCFLEWADDNPISIGSMENLAQIISTTESRAASVLQQWRELVERAKRQETVTIIESRFWQTDAMYLYLSGHSEREVTDSHRQVVAVVSEIDPVLIYLAPQNIGRMLARVTDIKNRKWRESGRAGSWDEWGNDVYERQKWFTDRSLQGSEAVLKFLTEWASIADRLFEQVPFRKIKIGDPEADWTTAMGRIGNFLELGDEAC